MARRHRRIVPLENLARQAVGLPLLRPAGRHFDVGISDHLSVSDRVTTAVGRMVHLSGHTHGSSTTSGNLTRVASEHRIVYDILSAAEIRERFLWDAAATGIGSLAGSTLWALTDQDPAVGGFVGGLIGYGYGVRLWRRTAE